MNHYNYLEEHLPTFFEAQGIPWEYNRGIIVAHGDKCYGYETRWEKAGIPFHKGVAIYLLTYNDPFSKEVRETKTGWVDPAEWVIQNASKYLDQLP